MLRSTQTGKPRMPPLLLDIQSMQFLHILLRKLLHMPLDMLHMRQGLH